MESGLNFKLNPLRACWYLMFATPLYRFLDSFLLFREMHNWNYCTIANFLAIMRNKFLLQLFVCHSFLDFAVACKGIDTSSTPFIHSNICCFDYVLHHLTNVWMCSSGCLRIQLNSHSLSVSSSDTIRSMLFLLVLSFSLYL